MCECVIRLRECCVPVFLQMIKLGLTDGSFIDELIEITAQSLAQLEIQEHFNIIKELGRGKYGKVLLVTHCFKGNYILKVLYKIMLFTIFKARISRKKYRKTSLLNKSFMLT